MAGLGLLGFFLFAVQTEFTREFAEVGWISVLFQTAVVGTVFLFIGTALGAGMWGLERLRRLPRFVTRRLLVGTGVVLLLWGALGGLVSGRPTGLYRHFVGKGMDKVSDVRAAGFRAHLASRWLFSFTVSAEDAADIARELGLVEDPSVDLGKSLEEEPFFSKVDSPAEVGIPEAGKLKAYSKRSAEEYGSAAWMALAVEEEGGRAWLFSGYQN
jgi:hypothetical protein